MFIRKTIISLLAVGSAVMLASCQSDDVEFDDYVYQTVYFSNQTPIRKIMLGDDVYPGNLDNDHRFRVYATLGGVWTNRADRKVQVVVDKSLCRGLAFAGGSDVLPLPDEYFSLSSNTITIAEGEVMGAVDVKLTDAFFADPKATDLNYVLPLRIVGATDSILAGKPKAGVTNPSLVDADDWDVLPKNYTLYALRYKNKSSGVWLCSGTDHIYTDGKETSVVNRQPESIEKAQLADITTVGLDVSRYNVSVNVPVGGDGGNAGIETKTCSLILTFGADGQCSVSTDTEGFTATGTGKWEYKGAKKAWNNKDRDKLTLDYEFGFTYMSGGVSKTMKVATSEVLVMRNRGDDDRLQSFSYTIRK